MPIFHRVIFQRAFIGPSIAGSSMKRSLSETVMAPDSWTCSICQARNKAVARMHGWTL